MKIENIDILALIPQRPPFVLVDRLTKCTNRLAVTEFIVPKDNIFVENKQLSFCGLVENVAQSCAARLGYKNLKTATPIKIGVIGSINNFYFERLPCVGEKLITSIEIREEVFSVILINATISIDGIEIAHSDMKIALTNTNASM